MFEKLTPLVLFDDYSLKARFMPAFICTIPFLIFIGFEFGILHKLESYPTLIGLYLCVLTFLAYKTRNLGKNLENKLILKNGYFPTTYMLSFGDNTFDDYTKKRYLEKLSNQLGIIFPMSKEEEANDNDSLSKYNSAVIWLKNNANNDKNRYPLVYKELIKYGFNRNLLGIKWYCILIYLLVIIWEVYQIKSFSINTLFKSPWPEYAVFILFTISFIAILSHTKNNLYSNALSYGKTLIETCDKF